MRKSSVRQKQEELLVYLQQHFSISKALITALLSVSCQAHENIFFLFSVLTMNIQTVYYQYYLACYLLFQACRHLCGNSSRVLEKVIVTCTLLRQRWSSVTSLSRHLEHSQKGRRHLGFCRMIKNQVIILCVLSVGSYYKTQEMPYPVCINFKTCWPICIRFGTDMKISKINMFLEVSENKETV